MTVTGLLVIPFIALSQIHSLQVSRHTEHARIYYRTGLVWILCFMTLGATLLYLCGKYVFLAMGGTIIDYSIKLYFTLIIFLASSALLSLSFSHLRARHETLLPQLAVNIIMLAFLTPALYNYNFIDPDIETFLMLQSGAAFAGFLVLLTRIHFVHRQDDETDRP
jgi:Na+-driven multidrug efflux pump